MEESISYHTYPIAHVDAMSACSSRSYPRHSHDQYGIGVVDEGGHSSWSGRGQVEAFAGELICCNPGEVTDGRAIGGRSRSWRMLYLEPALLQNLCADVREFHEVEFTFAKPVFFSEQTRQFFDSAFSATRHTELPEPMAIETALLNLVAQLQHHSTGCNGTAKEAAEVCIRRARNRIDADPAAHITLSDLATETELSRYQLIRAFWSQLGITPHAYIIQRRLQFARQLIKTRHSRAEVAAVSGFYDQPHLTRCFQRQFGVTPNRYAASLRG